MRVLVIIPTYNEAGNIQQIIPMILKLGSEFEILVVDDNSPDGTAKIVKKLQCLDEYRGRIHLIERPGKLGLGTAYVEGFKFALKHDYNFVFEIDADLSHDPSEIPKMLELARNGYDVVIGSRYITGVSVINWPMKRVLLSYMANKYARKVTGVPICDLTSGFKCFSRRVLESIELDKIKSNGYAFQIEMTFRAYYKGFRIVEHPIIFIDRRSGISKMNKKIILEAAIMVWKLKIENIFEKLKK